MKPFAATLLLLSLGAVADPAWSADQAPGLVQLDFAAQVQADGILADVEPDATLTPAMQAMLRTQVANWRYLPGTWQGRPVPRRITQRIVAEAVPAGAGGFALRIRSVTGVPVVLDTRRARAVASMVPPRYPEGAQRQGIEATLVYAMRRDPQGAPIDVELVDAQVAGNWEKQFDLAARHAIRSWRLEPIEVDGQAIDCRLLTPITFRLGSDRAPPAREETDLRPYLPRYADACPLAPTLRTEVVGALL